MFRDRAAEVTYEVMDKAICSLGTRDVYPYPSSDLGVAIAGALTRLSGPGPDQTFASAILEFDALEGVTTFDDFHREKLWVDLVDAAEALNSHCKFLNQKRDAILETPEEAGPDA